MIDNEKKLRSKKQISNDLKNKELTEMIVGLFSFMILSCLFGYIGYVFCTDNNYDIQRGIVFGALFPIGLAFLKEMNFGNILAYIVYIIGYIAIIEYIPIYVGIILLFAIVLLFIINFISICKKDRAKEVNRIYNLKHFNSVKETALPYKTEKIVGNSVLNKHENIDDSSFLEEYYCERCFKKIEQEECELYDGLCEECHDDVYFDLEGNPRRDYWNYLWVTKKFSYILWRD